MKINGTTEQPLQKPAIEDSEIYDGDSDKPVGEAKLGIAPSFVKNPKPVFINETKYNSIDSIEQRNN